MSVAARLDFVWKEEKEKEKRAGTQRNKETWPQEMQNFLLMKRISDGNSSLIAFSSLATTLTTSCSSSRNKNRVLDSVLLRGFVVPQGDKSLGGLTDMEISSTSDPLCLVLLLFYHEPSGKEKAQRKKKKSSPRPMSQSLRSDGTS